MTIFWMMRTTKRSLECYMTDEEMVKSWTNSTTTEDWRARGEGEGNGGVGKERKREKRRAKIGEVKAAA